MTLNEFLAELEKSKDDFELVRAPVTYWDFGEQITSITDGVVRAKYTSSIMFCPITKVAHEVTGCFFPTDKVFEAAQAINLENHDAGEIIKAADHSCNDKFKLRVKILKILNLKEVV